MRQSKRKGSKDGFIRRNDDRGVRIKQGGDDNIAKRWHCNWTCKEFKLFKNNFVSYDNLYFLFEEIWNGLKS